MKTDDSKNEKLADQNQNSNDNATNLDSDDSDTTLDSIGLELTGSMPEVQQHAIDQELENRSEISDSYAGLVDKNGDSFDPKRHKTKSDGSPTISKTNKLMLKPNAPAKGSSKPASASTTQNSGQDAEEPKVLSETEKQQCTALGKVSANMIFACGRMVGGDEWIPQKQNGYDEAAALEQAFADYYIASGKTEMSPAAGLGIALASYALPRFTMPKTKEKTASLTKKVYAWWHNRKGAKEEASRQKAEKVRKDSEKKDVTFEA